MECALVNAAKRANRDNPLHLDFWDRHLHGSLGSVLDVLGDVGAL